MAKRQARRSTARDLAQIAVFAALIAALGLPGVLYLGTSAVPITLQSMGAMLAGAILGARKGSAAVAVFLVLAFAGLPLLAGGRGGPQWFTVQPNAGYLYGFLAGALVIGLLTARILPAYPLWLGILVTALGGIVIVYALGIPWTAAVLHLPLWTAIVQSLQYLPGDAIKVVATAVVAKQVHRAYPGLIPLPARRRSVGGTLANGEDPRPAGSAPTGSGAAGGQDGPASTGSVTAPAATDQPGLAGDGR